MFFNGERSLPGVMLSLGSLPLSMNSVKAIFVRRHIVALSRISVYKRSLDSVLDSESTVHLDPQHNFKVISSRYHGRVVQTCQFHKQRYNQSHRSRLSDALAEADDETTDKRLILFRCPKSPTTRVSGTLVSTGN